MTRALLAAALIMLTASGCRMGEHPYDYCGPVWSGPQNCDPDYRAGSVLVGHPPRAAAAADVN
jgi:hypothetical protein